MDRYLTHYKSLNGSVVRLFHQWPKGTSWLTVIYPSIAKNRPAQGWRPYTKRIPDAEAFVFVTESREWFELIGFLGE